MSLNDLRTGRYSQPGMEYLLTFVVRDRAPVFSDFRAAREMIRVLRDSSERGESCWLAWVVMPDHFHGLLMLPGPATLSRVAGALKGRSARQINTWLGCRGALWQPGFHDHALRVEEDRAALARYVIDNPVRAGLVRDRYDYPHWDCVWL